MQRQNYCFDFKLSLYVVTYYDSGQLTKTKMVAMILVNLQKLKW